VTCCVEAHGATTTVVRVPRPTSLTPARVFVALRGLLGIMMLAPATPARSAETQAVRDDGDPLSLHIDRLTPSIVTGDRDITLSGTVTNTSDETWSSINIAPFRSDFPITDSTTLAAAAELPVKEYVGD